MTTPEQRAIKHLSTRLLIIEQALEFLLTALQRMAPQEIERHLEALRQSQGEQPAQPEVVRASIELLEDAVSRAAGRRPTHSPFQR
jgi:Arc/MetJ-type ribon-helix-helix transcriptional regulator